jgi:serine/threonine protein kinase
MALETGSKLGHYEILSSLGAGGMGEVYRAKDTKLGREVAIKLLLEEVSEDPERLARFAREARVLASLNHAHIATLHGFESDGNTSFLVMELVEGPTLGERIELGPMTLDEARPLVLQIADGLAAAHDLGVVHRDLKPANIKLAADGAVKILDFGLAKAMAEDAQGDPASSLSPTLTLAATQRGEILGTAAYMSPEQARGQTIDKRTDVWSLGVILWEMLTGRRLFDGETLSDTLADVLRAPIDEGEVPGAARRVLAACLQRDKTKRLQDVGDLRLLLEAFEAGPEEDPVAPRRSLWLWPALAALAIVVAGVAVLRDGGAPPSSPASPVTFEVTHPGLAAEIHAVSPDGRSLAFAGDDDRLLWIRGFDSLDPRPVPGSERLRTLTGVAWSPDSQSLVYLGGDGLRRVDLSTGLTATLVAQSALPSGGGSLTLRLGSWSTLGTVLYSVFGYEEAGVWKVPAGGGESRQVTSTGGLAGFDQQLVSGFLPDQRRFLYFVTATPGSSHHVGGVVRIADVELAPEEQATTPLLEADSPARFVPSTVGSDGASDEGHLLFVRGNGLYAQPFDSATATLAGDPRLVLPGVGSRSFSTSPAGTLAYRARGGGRSSVLQRFDRDGKVLEQIGPPSFYLSVHTSAEGDQLIATRRDANDGAQAYVVDLERGVFNRLNPGVPENYGGVPSPDGTVTFTHSPVGIAKDLYDRAANGVGEPRLIYSSDTIKHPNDWSPDGQWLIYDDHRPGLAQDLFIVGREGGEPIPFLVGAADDTLGRFSPDGRWIVYRSDESGRSEIYVRDFAPDRVPAYGDEKVLVSTEGGDKPRWSSDGREIYYLDPTGMLTAVSIGPGEPLEVGSAEPLFRVELGDGYVPYDVLPNSEFVINVVAESALGSAPIVVVMNLPSLLERRP